MLAMSRRSGRSRSRLVLTGALLGSLVVSLSWLPDSAAQQQSLLQQAGQFGSAVFRKFVGGQQSAQPSSQSVNTVAPAGTPATPQPTPQPTPQASPPGSPPGGVLGRVDQVGQAVTKVTGLQQVGKATQTADRVATTARTVVQNVRTKGKPLTAAASTALAPKPSPAAPTPQPVTPTPTPAPLPASPRPARTPPP